MVIFIENYVNNLINHIMQIGIKWTLFYLTKLIFQRVQIRCNRERMITGLPWIQGYQVFFLGTSQDRSLNDWAKLAATLHGKFSRGIFHFKLEVFFFYVIVKKNDVSKKLLKTFFFKSSNTGLNRNSKSQGIK